MQKKPIPCLHCQRAIVSTGYNFIWVHVDPFDPWYPEECRPTHAAPNFHGSQVIVGEA